MPSKQIMFLVPIFTLSLLGLQWGDDVEYPRNELFKQKFEHVQMSVVRVVRIEDNGDERTFGTGVIVSRKGHVVIRNTTTPLFRPILAGDKLRFYFANGSSYDGVTLGWSEEHKLAMAKLSGDGPWRSVELCGKDQLRTGTPCISLGYIRPEVRYSKKPAMTIGNVSMVAPGTWLSSTCEVSNFDAIFDMQGRLLGITTCKPIGRDKIHTHAAMLRELWNELAAGKNVDRERALSISKQRDKALPADLTMAEESLPGDAREIARRTTVQIRPADPAANEQSWSGVAISESGYVATCGHHGRRPGYPVTIHFSDGRYFQGKVLGSNPITDVGVVKITDEGEWPFTNLGLSQQLASGSRCIIAGYPTQREGNEPLLRETTIVEPDKYVWSSLMLTDGNGYKLHPGDSGGGVFDSNGFLVGLHEGMNPGAPGRHRRSEFLILQWSDLTAAQTTKD